MTYQYIYSVYCHGRETLQSHKQISHPTVHPTNTPWKNANDPLIPPSVIHTLTQPQIHFANHPELLQSTGQNLCV